MLQRYVFLIGLTIVALLPAIRLAPALTAMLNPQASALIAVFYETPGDAANAMIGQIIKTPAAHDPSPSADGVAPSRCGALAEAAKECG